ncbi:MAG: PIN domain-containing protein [Firmicutes bacterium]|nr:PIN domain-containing protein [Bacillota bacterium]
MVQRQVFVDTCAWVAFFNEDDPNHELVEQFFSNFSLPLLTSNYIFDEALTLIRSRLGHKEAMDLGTIIRDKKTTILERVLPEDEEMAWRIFCRYDDKAFSFTDCTSFALMERLGIIMAFTFDQHFKQYGNLICLPQEYWTLHEERAAYTIHPSTPVLSNLR